MDLIKVAHMMLTRLFTFTEIPKTLCIKPSKISDSKKCKNGHDCVAFETPRPGFGCDDCEKSFPAGTMLYGCRECNYDLCEDCDGASSRPLTALLLSNNKLNGKIPVELSKLPSLSTVLLDNNEFSGKFPKELGELSKLKKFHCHFNKLSGEVPEAIDKNPDRIEFLYGNNTGNPALCAPIREEKFEGDMEAVRECWRFMIMADASGSASGADTILYDQGGDKDIEKWKGIVLRNNRVTEIDWRGSKLLGTIPDKIGELTELRELHLGSSEKEKNDLTGKIPSSIGKCKKLKVLDLKGNKLSGSECLRGAKRRLDIHAVASVLCERSESVRKVSAGGRAK